MAMTGYNPEEVRESINNSVNAYRAYNSAMNTGIQVQFVRPMENVWACEEAQRVFGEHKTAMDEIYRQFNDFFASLVSVMNAGGSRWAAATESSYTPTNYDVIPNAVDVSGIRVDINGVKGIDKQQADQIATCLPRIAQEATTALNNLSTAVNRCGFIGDDQQETLTNSINNIRTTTQQYIQDLTTKFRNNVNSTVEKYGETALTTKSSFEVQQ